jgi:hypothetical protein
VLIEVRAKQSSLVVSQIPKVPMSPTEHLHRSGAHRNRAGGNLTADIGNNFDTAMSEFNVEVRIERSVIRDGKPPDEETFDHGLYTPEKSVWDEGIGHNV